MQDLGGRVKQGQKAHLVVCWVWIEDDTKDLPDNVAPKKIPKLRYYFVFNVSQCTGIPDRAKPAQEKKRDPIERCELLIDAMPKRPEIRTVENQAYYHHIQDYINMPHVEVFNSMDNYYAVLFHELIHSTGHESRLNRKELVAHTKYGEKDYSIEELTAEIGSCYLASYTGIALPGLTNSVAYIQGWLSRLQEDKRFVIYASANAQKAVDFILNVKPGGSICDPEIECHEESTQA